MIWWTTSVSAVTGEEPLSLEDAKEHLRITHNDEDRNLVAYLAAARDVVEAHTGRVLRRTTFLQKSNEFPADSTSEILLTRCPVSSITSIAYTDVDGNAQTWSSANYQSDLVSMPARVMPAVDQAYPTAKDQYGSVTITFVAGPADATEVEPADAQALKMLVSMYDQYREAIVAGSVNILHDALNNLIWRNRVYQFA